MVINCVIALIGRAKLELTRFACVLAVIALKPIQNHQKILLLTKHLSQRLVFTILKNNP
jgi:hypothetical protein